MKGINKLKMYIATFILSNFLLMGIMIFSPIFVALFFNIISFKTFLLFWILYFATYSFWNPHLKKPASYSKFLSYVSMWEYSKFYLDWVTLKIEDKDNVLSNENKIDNKQYLFAVQPHAILIYNRIQFYGETFKNEMFSNPTMFAAANALFYIPGCRECCILGQGCSANKKVLKKVLKAGESIALWIGGNRELMRTDPESINTEMVILDRKGFVRLCVEQGVDLVPCLQMGEKWIYRKYRFPVWLKQLLYGLCRIPGMAFLGRFGTFLPYNQRENGKPIRVGVIIGKPIKINKMKNTNDDEYKNYIDDIHSKYMDSMKSMFDKYKSEYLYDDEETLTFVSAKTKKL